MSQLVECVPNFSEGNNQEPPAPAPGRPAASEDSGLSCPVLCSCGAAVGAGPTAAALALAFPDPDALPGAAASPGRLAPGEGAARAADLTLRPLQVIDAIAQAVAQTPGCTLLDVDAGPSTNRTVYTFVGRPEAVVEGALQAALVAARLIDMSRHKGEHPRMGALDVCPFIPVRGVSMADCVLCAEAFGQRLAAELGVPVYLYGEAARTAGRRTLPAIRAGEYEALPEKLKQAVWAPDFGPSTFVPSWGATVTGARKFLLAFNINLLSTKEQAHRIALNLREQGRGQGQVHWRVPTCSGRRGGAGAGKALPLQPGRLKKVQGIGWYLDEKNLAQVSTNLLDFEVTPLHTVYEETCREARVRGWAGAAPAASASAQHCPAAASAHHCPPPQELSLPVVGSQLVGLVPLKALLDAAAFYCERDKLFVLEEEHRLRLVGSRGAWAGASGLARPRPSLTSLRCTGGYARCGAWRCFRAGCGSNGCSLDPSPGVVSRLGLDSLAPFNPKERVIEYLVPDQRPGQSLVDKPLGAFVREVGARSAAPGGGSVAAASAAMGAALASMAGLMTYGRRQFEHLDSTMRRLIPPFHTAMAELTGAVDADACAFEAYLEAMKLPKGMPEERDRRAAALQEGLRRAVAVPLALAETVASLWPALQELALDANLACRSDLQVAAKALETGVFGAYFNVLINLKDLTDEAFKDQVSRRGAGAWHRPCWERLPEPRSMGGHERQGGQSGSDQRALQVRQRISSLLQDAKTQVALVLERLEARQD
ncbi:Formimidoyltransferase-cyclodeaminase [Galemys pyrenaicus]|uniref:Formimidoyltransferase-cyclodeaminase n=1 Tax=Galemys pyrenaicus TaxID=202257 RepID=A0A8J6A8V9_GALPY|nr:Formimidoyltransferase-cyclodeaminase [Galemys pyrenaicus]